MLGLTLADGERERLTLGLTLGLTLLDTLALTLLLTLALADQEGDMDGDWLTLGDGLRLADPDVPAGASGAVNLSDDISTST